jgi:hypothetical protein
VTFRFSIREALAKAPLSIHYSGMVPIQYPTYCRIAEVRFVPQSHYGAEPRRDYLFLARRPAYVVYGNIIFIRRFKQDV